MDYTSYLDTIGASVQFALVVFALVLGSQLVKNLW